MAVTGERYTEARRSAGQELPEVQPYFIALVSGQIGLAGHGASIRDVRTGAVTDMVKPPPGDTRFNAVTSAGGGVFFLTGWSFGDRDANDPADPGRTDRRSIRTDRVRRYRLRVDKNGRASELEPLPDDLLPTQMPCHIAACPGGETLAYSSSLALTRATVHTTQAGLVYPASGQRTRVSLPAGRLGDLSWAGDRRTVAFTWHPVGQEPGVYVADSSAGNWVTGGRLVEATLGLPGTMMDPQISADGSEIYCTVAEGDPRGGTHWNRLLAVPVRGGKHRVLFELRYRPDSYNLHYMWTTTCRDITTGRFLLVFSTGYVYRIEVQSAKFDRLPFPEGRPMTAAW
ncbi:MAG TPA: hypothetical protein VF070_43760 [Streptosporangiaceae bacterium]